MMLFNFILAEKSYFCTCEFELRANLASVQALDRSISNRKNGSASLEEHEDTVYIQTIVKDNSECERRASHTSVL